MGTRTDQESSNLTELVVAATVYESAPSDPSALDALLAALGRLRSWLERRERRQRMQFRMRDDITLRNLRRIVKAVKDRRAESMYSTVFANLLEFHPATTATRTTAIFDQFVKGITVFSHDAQPGAIAYHRDASCGSRRLTRQEYKDTRSCRVTHTGEQLRLNKRRIRRCYVERLLYDRIYNEHALFFPDAWDQESAQDRGHRGMLEDVRRDFESCFPNVDIAVDVRFTDGGVPVALTVTSSSKRLAQTLCVEHYVRTTNRVRDVETYEDIYTERVVCVMETPAARKHKVQWFSGIDRRWLSRHPEAEAIDAMLAGLGPLALAS